MPQYPFRCQKILFPTNFTVLIIFLRHIKAQLEFKFITIVYFLAIIFQFYSDLTLSHLRLINFMELFFCVKFYSKINSGLDWLKKFMRPRSLNNERHHFNSSGFILWLSSFLILFKSLSFPVLFLCFYSRNTARSLFIFRCAYLLTVNWVFLLFTW
jgi:hypothetical protein